MISNVIANTLDPVMFQSERLGVTFSAFFDCPDGTYETSLYNAETQWYAVGQRLFNVNIQGQQVLSNYDIIAAAGGSNTAVITTFTNTVLNGQLEIDFSGVATTFDNNARVSAIRVRKIADPVYESIPPTINLFAPANDSTVAGSISVSGTASDNVAVAKVEISIDGGTWILASGTTSWSYSFNTQTVLNGLHSISARATDGSGNVSSIPSVTVRVINVPGAYLARISPGNPSNVTDCATNVWVADQAYTPGSFGYSGGTAGYLNNPISGVCTSVYPLYQREHYGNFSYLFDCPSGIYETTLLEAETYWSSTNARVFNVFLQGQQVLTNFDIFKAAGGQNIPISRVFTCAVAAAQLEMDFIPIIDNARASGIQVRKVADLDSDGDGIPDWWMLAYFNHPTGQSADNSLASEDADGTGQDNLFKYVAGLNPIDPTSVFVLNIDSVPNQPSQNYLLFTPLALGRTYIPQFSLDLVGGIWTELTGFAGPVTNGGQVSITDLTATQSNKFYRIHITYP
jgi:hypothetical protein